MSTNLPEQSPDLPEIDIAKIKDSKLARKIAKLLNLLENLLRLNNQLSEENQTLKDEISKLKGHSLRPRFKAKGGDHSVAKELKKKMNKLGLLKPWFKSSKKEKIGIDRVIELPEVGTCVCGSLDFKILRTNKKIVQGIAIRRNNTLYRGKDKQCLSCGKIYKAEVPEEIKGVEFDAETRSWISYWKYFCRKSEPLIHHLLSSMGMKISIGQVSNIILKNSRRLTPAYTHLKVWGVKSSPYLQSDATGAKRRSKLTNKITNQHLHFVGHKLLSIFAITRRYNSSTMGKILTKRGMNLPFLSDDHGANGKKLLIRHKQLCWYHETEHYLKLTPHFSFHKQKLRYLVNQIWDFYFKAEVYGKTYGRGSGHDPAGEGGERDPTLVINARRGKDKQALEKQFEEIFSQRTGYDQLDNRLALTAKKKERLLLFLDHPHVPIHNNQAERDLRPAVILRRLSGGTKSRAGDRSLERHLSIIQTAEKRGLDVFQTLHGLLTNQLSPSCLTHPSVLTADL